ncbi:hypothetical protein, conserved [Cyanidioschyzon merolae strain 10D]|uniref:Activator of Hsp90 ATPase AHSA1-like N-terminal domain-containing protein n=1 Tax=Cyanidioschyzon merolae (strain NIES-3377 / 10D) TaxID=280699 RepID=M1VKB6_CYAM1|nr:hypothetical protein, conserved [Cyanidioschyzon merolae strain 10D]BAM81913.1 hypothetical protein, conserved [Cyanidioschyzon merolae strain 10D]|eukprot:XP_005537949.1 hypothetical protein, conserved [Cyanidioschyzon merolae strain 10D]
MALAGQGDPRWIVQDLGKQGKNVGNWHWTERDISVWAMERLRSLLQEDPIGELRLADDTVQVQVTGSPSVHGDCALYNRKGKLRSVYDLKVQADWEARSLATNAVCGKGTIEAELFDTDPDVTITPTGTWEHSAQLVSFLTLDGKSWLHRVLERFQAEALQLGTGDTGSTVAGQSQAAEAVKNANKDHAGNTAATSGVQQPEQSTQSTWTSLHMEERFRAPPSVVFRALTAVEELQRITQAPATSDTTSSNGTFSLYAGQVHGSYTKLQEPELIEQRWRMADWVPRDHYSRVQMRLKAVSDDETLLVLQQDQIPEEYLERTQVGWRERIFAQLRLMYNLGSAYV